MNLVDMQIRAARTKVNIALGELRRHLMTAVANRDGTNCWYCGCETITIDQGHPRRRTLDHVIPQSFGGKDDLDNLRIACSACNSRKGAQVDRALLCPQCRGRTLDTPADYQARPATQTETRLEETPPLIYPTDVSVPWFRDSKVAIQSRNESSDYLKRLTDEARAEDES